MGTNIPKQQTVPSMPGMTIDEMIISLRNHDLLCYDNDLQIAEWLEELKFFRTAKDTMFREIYNRALEDASNIMSFHQEGLGGYYTLDPEEFEKLYK